MKKALVFRTAQTHVMLKLLEKLERKGYKVWCVIQESSLESLRSEFPSVNYISVPDGFFDYKQFMANKPLIEQIKRAKCKRVFVPSSTYNFNNFLEVRRIIYRLGFRKVTYFVSYGKAVIIDLTFSEICAERLVKSEWFMQLIFLLGNAVSFVCFIKNKLLRAGG